MRPDGTSTVRYANPADGEPQDVEVISPSELTLMAFGSPLPMGRGARAPIYRFDPDYPLLPRRHYAVKVEGDRAEVWEVKRLGTVWVWKCEAGRPAKPIAGGFEKR